MDGLILLDITQGRPLLRSSFAHHPPAYPLLHVEAYLAARPDPPPIIPLLPPATPSAVCHISNDSLALIASISNNADPLLAFALLETLSSLLHHHLNASSLSPVLIKENYHLVFQLIEELLQNDIPTTTDPNLLRDILLPDTFINKIMSISPVAAIAKSSPSPFTSPIPWRQAGVRHGNNEIFFDIVEQLECLVSRYVRIRS
jgi:AP-3 complex subunit mu